MVKNNDLDDEEMREAWKEWNKKQRDVVQEIKETLGEIEKTEPKKEVLFGGALSVIAVSTILAVTSALGFWLYEML